MVTVFLYGVRVDQDVIQVNEDAYIQEIQEDVVHEALKSSRSIGKCERHDIPFKRSVASAEGGFPFIALVDPDKVVSVLQIDLGIDLSLVWTV